MTPASPAPLAGLRVLVVEDDDQSRDVFGTLLRQLGAAATTAATAQDAMGKLQKVNPHVVICDLSLPDHDGYWLLRKAQNLHLDAPFVAATGRNNDGDRAKSVGFAAYLRKPIGADALVAVILRVLDGSPVADGASVIRLDERRAREPHGH